MSSSIPPTSLHACAIRVPCSTSNLGAGFDCIGLALDRYLDAGFEPGDDHLTIRRAGTLHDLDTDVAHDALVLAFLAELHRRGVDEPRGTLLATSTIPAARGLGASGAATVAGIALATAACGDTLDRDVALASAAQVEGHPDNAAPSLFGGLVAVAYSSHGVPRVMPLPLDDGIRFVFAAPATEVSTAQARAALPELVPHIAAVRNLGRLAALLHGLANADATSIAIGFADELHTPYRLPLIPHADLAIRAGTDAGAWAVAISGSGSGLIAACPPDSERAVIQAMVGAFGGTEDGAIGFAARADMHGVQPRDVHTLRDALSTVT